MLEGPRPSHIKSSWQWRDKVTGVLRSHRRDIPESIIHCFQDFCTAGRFDKPEVHSGSVMSDIVINKRGQYVIELRSATILLQSSCFVFRSAQGRDRDNI